jgi:hypothetical protein
VALIWSHAAALGQPGPDQGRGGVQLSEVTDDGHRYLPEPNLIADAAKILEARRT